MKQAKVLTLFTAVLVAQMVFAASASATALTSNGLIYTGVLAAEAGENTLHGSATNTCGSSKLEANVETHGSFSTAFGPITKLTFELCNQHVVVLKKGELIFHADVNDPVGSSGNGTVTWRGGEVTFQFTSLGISCILGSAEEVDIGTFTSSNTTGKTAVLDINARIPRTGHSIFCGASWEWTGSYTFTVPDNLNVH